MTAFLSNGGEAPPNDLDTALVVKRDERPNLRKTHPNLFRLLLADGLLHVALGCNFLSFVPTFRVYDLPNPLWGAIFLTLGLASLFFLCVARRLRAVRALTGASVAYIVAFALGTMQPALEGAGSLQLPMLYFGLATLQLALLLEPFINPWTARRDA